MSARPDATRRGAMLRVGSHAVGQGTRIGSTIYGTVLVMAALTAAYAAERHDPGKLVELVVCSVLVFWIAHVYAHSLSESIRNGRRVTGSVIGSIAGREVGIVLAAVVPVAALLLGVIGLIDESHSVWLAIGLGLATLTVQGYRYARAVSLGLLGTLLILVANLALGASVVIMKVTLIH